MMKIIWNWLLDNKEWIFSGFGVFLLGLVLAYFRRKKKTEQGDTITTHGDLSPGKVNGDYKVRIDEQQKWKD